MKRITAFTTLFVLLLMAALGVNAAESDKEMEIIYNHDNSASSTVVYGIDEAYTVTIPADVSLKLGETVEQDVAITDVYLPLAKSLSLTLASDNYDKADKKWNVILDTDEKVKIPYSITKDGVAVASKDVILTCNSRGETNAVSTKLAFTVGADPVQSGTYVDTLTFNVAILVIN